MLRLMRLPRKCSWTCIVYRQIEETSVLVNDVKRAACVAQVDYRLRAVCATICLIPMPRTSATQLTFHCSINSHVLQMQRVNSLQRMSAHADDVIELRVRCVTLLCTACISRICTSLWHQYMNTNIINNIT